MKDNINDKKFLELCRKHQPELIALFQAHVFETKGTKIILNFDGNGVLQEIVQGERQLWRRKRKFDK